MNELEPTLVKLVRTRQFGQHPEFANISGELLFSELSEADLKLWEGLGDVSNGCTNYLQSNAQF